MKFVIMQEYGQNKVILQVTASVNVGGGRGPRVDREGRRLPSRGE